MMVRYFLRLAYDGHPFHGWQVQQNAVSVQQTLNDALSVLLKASTETYGCGRTDTGVHARDYYAHFDTVDPIPEAERFLRSLNAILPAAIAVFELLEVAPDAHARFDAFSRTYEYQLVTRKDPFLHDQAYYFPHPLDLSAMNKAAARLLVQEDFGCFSKSGRTQRTTVCRVTHAAWERHGDRFVFTITANRFLRNMVRAIVGTLLEVGEGECSFGEFEMILTSGDRSDAGISVPAHGLFLVRIEYHYLQRRLHD